MTIWGCVGKRERSEALGNKRDTANQSAYTGGTSISTWNLFSDLTPSLLNTKYNEKNLVFCPFLPLKGAKAVLLSHLEGYLKPIGSVYPCIASPGFRMAWRGEFRVHSEVCRQMHAASPCFKKSSAAPVPAGGLKWSHSGSG